MNKLPFALLITLFLPSAEALAADASKAWPASCRYSYQGVYQPGVVHEIDCNVSTAVFPGVSSSPLEVKYGDKSYCTFIDNNSTQTLFLPLKTEREWLAFFEKFTQHPGISVTLSDCNRLCGENKPIVSFVIDESGSIGTSNFLLVKSFFSQLVDTMDYVDKAPANVIFFSTKVNATSPFRQLSDAAATKLTANFEEELVALSGKTDAERQAIEAAYLQQRKAIRSQPGYDQPVKDDMASHAYLGGYTALGDALSTAVDKLNAINYTKVDGTQADKLIVLFTDGKRTSGKTVESVLPKIVASNIKTFVIGVGRDYVSLLPPVVTACAKYRIPTTPSYLTSYRAFKDTAELNSCLKTACTKYIPSAPTQECVNVSKAYYDKNSWDDIVNYSLDVSELNAIANAGLPAGQAPGANYRLITNFPDLAASFKPVASDICKITRSATVTK